MKYHYLTVDGMLSGTGIRNTVSGGYIAPAQLGLPESMIKRIEQWLLLYENAHYAGFDDEDVCDSLDREGISISSDLQRALPESKIEYYSHARQSRINQVRAVPPSR